MVVACSALKRAYRDILIGPRADVRLAYLRGSRRPHPGTHGRAPATTSCRRRCWPSQFAALEEPGPAENPIVVDVTRPPEALADEIAAALRRG